ncbi:sel1 repeat family protein, partial [Pseudomonas japonica]
MRWVVIISFLLSVSCGVSNKAVASILSGVEAMSDIGRLNFSCSYEEGPGYAGDLDVLFRYARWLQVNNQLIRDEGVYAQAERLYRIASEGGHYKANINLQIGAMRGYFKVKGYERLRMSQELIDAKVAAGYLMVARMLQVGGGGLKKDEEMSLKFYRKAADEGNASAQAYVADKLASIPALSEVARDMRRCAAAQSHGEAAVA